MLDNSLNKGAGVWVRRGGTGVWNDRQAAGHVVLVALGAGDMPESQGGTGGFEQMVGYCDSPPRYEQYFPVLLMQMLFIFQTGMQSRKENMVSLRAKVME